MGLGSRRFDAEDGGDAEVDVGFGRRPRGDADAHRGAALPHGDAGPAGAFGLDGGDHPGGAGGVAEGQEDLVENDVVENLEARCRKFFGEAASEGAIAGDEGGKAGAAEGVERGPDLDAAGATGKLGREIGGVARGALGGEIGGGDGHSGLKRVGIADEG